MIDKGSGPGEGGQDSSGRRYRAWLTGYINWEMACTGREKQNCEGSKSWQVMR